MSSYSVPKEAPASDPDHSAHSHAETLPEGHPPVNQLPEGHPEVAGGLPEGHPAVQSVGVGMDMASAQAAGIQPPAAPDRGVTWKTPAGWTEKPGSGFRYASFVVPGTQGMNGDLSVTQLVGEAGGLLSNVNRWRGQLGLGPLSETALSSESRRINPGGRPMTFVNFVSADALIDGKYKKRLMAAVSVSDGRTWFFKLVGDDRGVQAAEKDFLKFLESLQGL